MVPSLVVAAVVTALEEPTQEPAVMSGLVVAALMRRRISRIVLRFGSSESFKLSPIQEDSATVTALVNCHVVAFDTVHLSVTLRTF